jgi:hypothetical protein
MNRAEVEWRPCGAVVYYRTRPLTHPQNLLLTQPPEYIITPGEYKQLPVVWMPGDSPPLCGETMKREDAELTSASSGRSLP